MKEVPQKGDIFFTDSDAGYAVVVKFLMQSPTVWHWLIGKVRKALGRDPFPFIDPVRYYHAGMVLDEERIIEQQKKVQIRSINKVLTKPHIIWRYCDLDPEDMENLEFFAKRDLGEGYDVLLILGKTLTWLTGIGWFTRTLQREDQEICVSRVAYWFYKALGQTFGKDSWHEVTTDDIDDWALGHSANWKIISIKEA